MKSVVRDWLLNLLHLSPNLVHSRLYDDTTFYHQFLADLNHAKKEVIIESPFLSVHRMRTFTRIFKILVSRKVRLSIFTHDPLDHDEVMQKQAYEVMRTLQLIGIQVIASSESSYRKLAIIDRQILWEGNLNILSQSSSREMMRRIESIYLSKEVFLRFSW